MQSLIISSNYELHYYKVEREHMTSGTFDLFQNNKCITSCLKDLMLPDLQM